MPSVSFTFKFVLMVLILAPATLLEDNFKKRLEDVTGITKLSKTDEFVVCKASLCGAVFNKRVRSGFVLYGSLLVLVCQGLFVSPSVDESHLVHTTKLLGRQILPHSLPAQNHHHKDDDALQTVEDIRHEPGDVKLC